MPVLAMAQPVVDHQKRFQAAVDVIHNLPKNGSYQPSYEVMLRFYSLYKQAVCGPCTAPRPGFWDPVGRYKWDAWSRLGELSSESAMAAYVDEMKKVAQEVINTMPVNEKTASLFHHFEPLYLVIDDMPRPPQSLLTLKEGFNGSENADGPAMVKGVDEEQGRSKEDPPPPEAADPRQGFNPFEVTDLTGRSIPNDSGVSEGLALTSDSESEIFCDSVDSVEQLGSIKVVKANGFHNGLQLESHLEIRRVGAGQGGEGSEDAKGRGPSRSRDTGRERSYHTWGQRGVPQDSLRRGGPGGGGGDGAAGRGGGRGSESGAERLHDAQLQQQIVLALRRLREDMRSVMDRLEVVERLTATQTQVLECRPCLQCSASRQQEESWWPFDMSGQTVLLFLLWPFVAQGLVYLLRKAQRRNQIAS